MALGLLIAGLVLLSLGAEGVVRTGSRLARRLGMSPVLIGVTIVAVGTSAPELAIAIGSAGAGTVPLAVGNVAGTNTANILLVLGLSALLDPLRIERPTIRFGLPAILAAAALLTVAAWDHQLGRVEGVVLLAGAVLYLATVAWRARRSHVEARQAAEAEAEVESDALLGARVPGVQVQALPEAGGGGVEEPTARPAGRQVARDLVVLVVSLAAIVLGADWLVDGAVELARRLGVSEAFIGVTVVAIGTSAPELATTAVATIRRDRELAVGNLLGSSVFNILLILGVALVIPAAAIDLDADLVHVDIPVMAATSLVLLPVFLTGRRVSRVEGGAFVAAYGAYLTYLILTRT